MTLRLRCIRCGEWDEMDPREIVAWGICGACCLKSPGLTIVKGRWDAAAVRRWDARWQKGMGSHPTYKALTAALDAMSGTLVVPDV